MLKIEELKKEAEQSKFYSKRAYEKMILLSAFILALNMDKKKESKISKIFLLIILFFLLLDSISDISYTLKKIKGKR